MCNRSAQCSSACLSVVTLRLSSTHARTNMELRGHFTLSPSLSTWRSSPVATAHGQHVIPVLDMGLVCECMYIFVIEFGL